ncbi:hypothetical protein Pfo_009109 [Paulownia fortunei]|nr:hypothetical protein Pfo_009109 [Paulownia fortunei]
MKTFIQTYVIFLICIVLYFTSSEHAFCYGREGDYLSRIISLFGGNKHFITQENHMTNQPNDNGNPTNYSVFNVLNYGAKGDGTTNDTEAFKRTWDAACKAKGGVMLVPSGYTFLLQLVTFDGSYCQPNIVVQVDGKIVAPSNKSEWVTSNIQWILFQRISKGITIKGYGVIDGRGLSWWNSKDSDKATVVRPHAVRILYSSNVIVTGIRIQNAPRMHIFIDSSQYIQIFNFTVWSPGDSPNTDGIHISRVQHIDIHNTTLACGDDCVSIQTGCSDVKIYNVKCGPGHGYSIGGLGPNKLEAQVSDIAVLNSTVQNSLTGVRIKTWPSGYGSVHNVTFSNIAMSDVQTAICIDQYYCGGPKNCVVSDMNAVAVSNITYESITGTYTYRSVSLACSEYKPCKNLTLANVNLIPSEVNVGGKTEEPYCSNAFGKVLTNTTPPLEGCLLSDGAPVPAVPPKALGSLF